MKFKILIIDDELDKPLRGGLSRRNYYEELSKAFDIEYLAKPSELLTILQSRKIHAVLLDFILDSWKTDVHEILQQIGDLCPVALVSKHWGPNFARLRVTRDKYGISQQFAWDEFEDPDKRELVILSLDAAIRKSKGVTSPIWEDSDPIRILQISDLQFGSPLPEGFLAETELMAQAIRRRWDAPPNFISLTGDMAERALPNEYAQAVEWIKHLARRLDPIWSDKRFLVIPGNHDVCLPLYLSGLYSFDKKGFEKRGSPLVQPELAEFAFAPFREFAGELGGESLWERKHHYWTAGQYRNSGIIFFGYNTCEDLDSEGRPTRKVVDKTLAQMFSEIRTFQEDAPDALVLGLLHHPFVCNDPATDAISNPIIFQKNLGEHSGTIVVLNGHVHADDCRPSAHVLEITASTVTKPGKNRPPDTGRGFNMIELQRKNNVVTGLRVDFCRFERSDISVTNTKLFKRDNKGRIRDV